MKNSRIVKQALSALTATERELFSLLAKDDLRKDEVTGFLDRYKIDDESSVSTFLINDLLDKCHLQESDHSSVPRIRGVSAFYRFQNATALMRLPADEVIADLDLFLKIRFPDEVRPFPAAQARFDRAGLIATTGKACAEKVFSGPVPVKLQNREYLIPDDRFLPDIVFLGLYLALHRGRNRQNLLCYLYDVYRYCPDRKPRFGLRFSVCKKKIRHRLGRVKRWLFRSKH